jgi:multicomponent Na+:H+ antiporter subunit B
VTAPAAAAEASPCRPASRRTRYVFFALAAGGGGCHCTATHQAAGMAAALGVAFAGLPAFGSTTTADASRLNQLSVPVRHATDVVAAVSFDFRGFDTLFEEFILVSAVAGVSVLLRPLAAEMRDRPEDEAPDRRIPAPSPTVGLFGVLFAPTLIMFGIETVAHGQISPGGGFQGGVILASAVFVVYIVTDYATVERYRPNALMEPSEGAGAGGYVLVGVVGLLAGAVYLTNVVPLGDPGNVVSGGTIPILNAVVGVEVTGGFVLLVSEFLDQLAVIRGRRRDR